MRFHIWLLERDWIVGGPEGKQGTQLAGPCCKSEMGEDWIRVETQCKARGSTCVNEYTAPWAWIPKCFSSGTGL